MNCIQIDGIVNSIKIFDNQTSSQTSSQTALIQIINFEEYYINNEYKCNKYYIDCVKYNYGNGLYDIEIKEKQSYVLIEGQILRCKSGLFYKNNQNIYTETLGHKIKINKITTYNTLPRLYETYLKEMNNTFN